MFFKSYVQDLDLLTEKYMEKDQRLFIHRSGFPPNLKLISIIV